MNPLDSLLKFHLGQHVYFWFMLPLHGIVVVLQTISKLIFVKYEVCLKFELLFNSGTDRGCVPYTYVLLCQGRENV